MNRVTIGVVAPCKDFAATVEKLTGNMEDAEFLILEEHGELISSLHEWEKEGKVEGIVARGLTAAELKKQLRIPVVAAEPSSFDLAEALWRARAFAHEIALLCFESQPSRIDFDRIAGVLGVKFKVFAYRTREEAEDVIEQVLYHRVGAVACTEPGDYRKIGSYGLKAVLVRSGREVVCDALKKALKLCQARRRDIRLCRYFQAILGSSYDGILAVEDGRVTIFNPVAEKVTGIKAVEVLGKPAAEVCRANDACQVLLGDGKEVKDFLVYLEDTALMVNRVPVRLGMSNGLIVTFQISEKVRRMGSRVTRAREETGGKGMMARYKFSDIVGRSAIIREAIREAKRYSRSDAPVLITGESGTGKELFAQSIHNESSRRGGPFVAVNCAALPESLLESELFGYEEGAFTGARKGGKQGLFVLAHGGTIFLDEIGDLSPGLQAKLLRVLQEKVVMPLGGQTVIPVDVRVVSATNQDLAWAIAEGRFRPDLYYRLNILHLHLPPLRERLEDVPELFRHFLERLAGPGSTKALQIDDELLEELKKYSWPGNVRELEGFVERYVALGEEDVSRHTTFYRLLEKLVRQEWGSFTGAAQHGRLPQAGILTVRLGSLEEMEKQLLQQASKLFQGSKNEMARMLGISRTTLWKKLKELE